jgi:hypothetical protein
VSGHNWHLPFAIFVADLTAEVEMEDAMKTRMIAAALAGALTMAIVGPAIAQGGWLPDSQSRDRHGQTWQDRELERKKGTPMSEPRSREDREKERELQRRQGVPMSAPRSREDREKERQLEMNKGTPMNQR